MSIVLVFNWKEFISCYMPAVVLLANESQEALVKMGYLMQKISYRFYYSISVLYAFFCAQYFTVWIALQNHFILLFTAQRYGSAVYATALCPSFCLSFCHMTRATKTAKHMVTQRALYNNLGRDSRFMTLKISAKFQWGHPQQRYQMPVGLAKIGNFRPISCFIPESVQERKGKKKSIYIAPFTTHA